MIWLLSRESLDEMNAAQPEVTTRQQQHYSLHAPNLAPRALHVESAVATIDVVGVLTAEPDLLALLASGANTTYAEILAALARAEQDPSVASVELKVDSPGGQWRGLYGLLTALAAFSKPVRVTAEQAASAAYAVAAAAGPITAASPASEFGSIGVAATVRTDRDAVTLANSSSPKKRPDPRTPEGQAVIRAYLDSVHSLIVDQVARGRKIDRATIDRDFGAGATLLAGQALERGMIDAIAGGPNVATRAAAPAAALAPRVQQQELASTYAIPRLTEREGLDVGELVASLVERRARPQSDDDDRKLTPHEASVGEQVATLIERRARGDFVEQPKPARGVEVL